MIHCKILFTVPETMKSPHHKLQNFAKSRHTLFSTACECSEQTDLAHRQSPVTISCWRRSYLHTGSPKRQLEDSEGKEERANGNGRREGGQAGGQEGGRRGREDESSARLQEMVRHSAGGQLWAVPLNTRALSALPLLNKTVKLKKKKPSDSHTGWRELHSF